MGCCASKEGVARPEEVRGGAEDAPTKKSGSQAPSDALADPADVRPSLRPPRSRAAFLEERWVPFLRELRRELMGVDERTLQRFSPEERMPSQKRVLELTSRCEELTAEWYGRPNLSAVYEWMIRASASAGLVAYAAEDVPVTRSADGFTAALDGRVRRSLYSHSKGSGADSGSKDDETDDKDEKSVRREVLDGGGESPIDNLQVSNVMTADEAKVLLATGHVRRVLLATLARKQRVQLKRISDELARRGRPTLFGMPLDRVRAALADTLENEPGVLEAARVNADTLSFRTLLSTGGLVRSWGQLDKESKRRVRHYVYDAVMGRDHDSCAAGDKGKSESSASSVLDGGAAPLAAPVATAANASGSSEDLDAIVPSPSPPTDRMREFVDWVRKHPGRYFQDDKSTHKKLLLLGMWSDSLSVVRRSAVEGYIPQRYVPWTWRRRVDLVAVEDGGELRVLRAAGSEEHSRFRANSFPYQRSHGLGLSSGGVEEGLDSWGSLRYEFGAGMPRDPAARLGNHFSNDFEKVAVEAVALSPARADAAGRLPGDEWHFVGQNTAAGSSIGATQHTQVSRATAAEWPATRLRHRPEWVPKLDAFVDVCQVGAHEDAFFVRVRARRPDSEAVVGLLQALRVAALRELGELDFSFGVMPEPDGEDDGAWFSAILAPVAALRFNGERSRSENPDTGQTSADAGCAGANIQDVLSLQGAAMTFTEEGTAALVEGLPALARLYDFARKPGARALFRRELEERVGYADDAAAGQVGAEDVDEVRGDGVRAATVLFPLMKQAGGRLFRFAESAIREEEEEEEEEVVVAAS